MNEDTYQSIIAWFEKFTSGYTDQRGKLHALLQLKLDHSTRVAIDCRSMAMELRWNESDLLLAYIAGLLHDVGRFPQFEKFQTFFDPSSLNHGECGYETISGSDALACCSAEEKVMLLDAVRYHNRRLIPESIQPSSIPLLKLIRDADKLDILGIVNDTVRTGSYKDYPEILLNIVLDAPPTPALIKEILLTRSGSYENVKSLADMALMRLSWIYDMNYGPTFRLLKNRRLLDDISSVLPDTEDVRAIIEGATAYSNQQLADG